MQILSCKNRYTGNEVHCLNWYTFSRADFLLITLSFITGYADAHLGHVQLHTYRQIWTLGNAYLHLSTLKYTESHWNTLDQSDAHWATLGHTPRGSHKSLSPFIRLTLSPSYEIFYKVASRALKRTLKRETPPTCPDDEPITTSHSCELKFRLAHPLGQRRCAGRFLACVQGASAEVWSGQLNWKAVEGGVSGNIGNRGHKFLSCWSVVFNHEKTQATRERAAPPRAP